MITGIHQTQTARHTSIISFRTRQTALLLSSLAGTAHSLPFKTLKITLPAGPSQLHSQQHHTWDPRCTTCPMWRLQAFIRPAFAELTCYICRQPIMSEKHFCISNKLTGLTTPPLSLKTLHGTMLQNHRTTSKQKATSHISSPTPGPTCPNPVTALQSYIPSLVQHSLSALAHAASLIIPAPALLVARILRPRPLARGVHRSRGLPRPVPMMVVPLLGCDGDDTQQLRLQHRVEFSFACIEGMK